MSDAHGRPSPSSLDTTRGLSVGIQERQKSSQVIDRAKGTREQGGENTHSKGTLTPAGQAGRNMSVKRQRSLTENSFLKTCSKGKRCSTSLG